MVSFLGRDSAGGSVLNFFSVAVLVASVLVLLSPYFLLLLLMLFFFELLGV